VQRPGTTRPAAAGSIQGGSSSRAIDFDYEITLLTVRARKRAAIVHLFLRADRPRAGAGDYVESWQPQAMTPAALQRRAKSPRGHRQPRRPRPVRRRTVHQGRHQVWFSEVSPRPHDTGLVTLCSQRFSEFELHARAILGLPVDTRLREPGASAVIYGGMDARALPLKGIADALPFRDSDLRLFGKPESFKKRRMGVAVANGDARQHCYNESHIYCHS
jgi:phosphoribosylglycinamide formyltransferase 2